MDYSYLNSEALNCRCCGGVLNVKSSLCVCDFCGTTNFVSSTASKYVNQLNRANKLRQEREFDKAARIYDIILKENAPTADILWLRTLCEYGIEYVPDPVSDKYFPTLHRISDESILKYHSYVEALALAEGEEKESLQKEAEHINTIQNEYLNIAANEEPYDVFICYKETDEETGEKTEDVELASNLYNDLAGRGFKVFFAKETLKTKLSIDYEPYIFAALKSSKAMIVLGTKAEYFMSVWVKNEWGRFLKLMQEDENKQMFFACDDPEKLPRAFATKQAQLLGKQNALKNLADNVEEYLRERCKPSLTYDEMYERAVSHLEAGDESEAKEYIDKIIERFPNHSQGYWLRLLSSFKTSPSAVADKQIDIFSNPDFYMAVNLAGDDLKEEYKKIAEICLNNIKAQREFNKALNEKSADYVRKFEESELAQKKNKIIDNLIGSEEVFNYFFKRSRWSAAIGYMLIILGAYVFSFSDLAVSELQYTYAFLRTEEPTRFITSRILISVPFIL
ncbi:MAG: TIR domain-containing protein, partial [Lachnospiraceae bacterium]|nr:TIR domain-containing protein [Lachnospiraceae bacterium]